jgi:hypothetical protein
VVAYPKDFGLHQQFCENLTSSVAISIAYCCTVLDKFAVSIVISKGVVLGATC